MTAAKLATLADKWAEDDAGEVLSTLYKEGLFILLENNRAVQLWWTLDKIGKTRSVHTKHCASIIQVDYLI